MAEYVLLLYAEEDDRKDRWEDMPLWLEVTESLREAGILVANAALQPAATSVRVRGGAVERVDGPFATTKEFLAGYYVLDCADLDEALRHAARLPVARYGAVEVRAVAGGPADAGRAGSR
jgi:hypothetical protein